MLDAALLPVLAVLVWSALELRSRRRRAVDAEERAAFAERELERRCARVALPNTGRGRCSDHDPAAQWLADRAGTAEAAALEEERRRREREMWAGGGGGSRG